MSTIKFNQWLNSDNTENFKCRAWVNFNGVGTIAIRAAGNVSSITDNGTGLYVVNFTTAMADANYAAVMGVSAEAVANVFYVELTNTARLVGSIAIRAQNGSAVGQDLPLVNVAIFR